MNRPSFVAPDFAGRCKIFPERDVMLLPYQQRWVNDNSRLKLCEKSRQIGLSWTAAYRVVRTKTEERTRGWMHGSLHAMKSRHSCLSKMQNVSPTFLVSPHRIRVRTSPTIKVTRRSRYALRTVFVFTARRVTLTLKLVNAATAFWTSFRCIQIRENSINISYPGIPLGRLDGDFLHASRHSELF